MKKYCKCGHSFIFHEFNDDILFHDELLVWCNDSSIKVYPNRREVFSYCKCNKFEVD